MRFSSIENHGAGKKEVKGVAKEDSRSSNKGGSDDGVSDDEVSDDEDSDDEHGDKEDGDKEDGDKEDGDKEDGDGDDTDEEDDSDDEDGATYAVSFMFQVRVVAQIGLYIHSGNCPSHWAIAQGQFPAASTYTEPSPSLKLRAIAQCHFRH